MSEKGVDGPGHNGEQEAWSPLSYAQKQLWLVHRIAPTSAAYNASVAFRIRGALDPAALEHAYQALLARHEVLRTRVGRAKGGPALLLQHTASAPMAAIDLAAVPEDEREDELLSVVCSLVAEPFDLEHGPLVRAALVRLSDWEHVLCLVVHHIVWDGISAATVCRQLGEDYARGVVGEPLDESLARPNYASYVRWLSEYVDKHELRRQMDYWTRQLEGAPPALDLVTDRVRSATSRQRAGKRWLNLDADHRSRLSRLAADCSTTLSTVMLAGWAGLLHRSSGQDDVVVGVPVLGRSLPEHTDLVGLFANTIAIRSSWGAADPFTEAARRIGETVFDGLDHQDLPLDRIVEKLAPSRFPGVHPVFQVFYAFERESDAEALALPGMEVTEYQIPAHTAKVALSLTVADSGDRLRLSLEYDGELFAPEDADLLLRGYVRLLETVCASPDIRLVDIDLVSEDEHAELVERWNPRCPLGYTGTSAVELIDAQARAAGDAVAVVQGDQSLTYEEFVTASRHLAARLLCSGVRRGDVVGVHLRGGPNQAVAVLAVLRAGAVFLPLEVDLPRERLVRLTGDAGVRVVVCDGSRADDVAGWPGATPVSIADDGERTLGDEISEPVTVDGQSPAYLIYTSGSTGEPKGVLSSHENLVGYALAARESFGLTDSDRFVQLAPFGFDVYVEETFPAWISGGRVVFPEPGFSFGPEELVSLIEDQGVTICELTTAYWNEFAPGLASEHRRLAPILRLLIIGGERPVADRVELWREVGIALANVYGLTEAAVTSTVFPLPLHGPEPCTDLPIGRPIPNSRVYVLDELCRPVPPGQIGELHVGGTGVALGYVNSPALTADRFLPDPFSPIPGARMYRTGDRGRFLPDGELEFLGRKDLQIKIRGYRIEPAEIERALEAHPSVDRAIVVVHGDGPAQRLVAHCVSVLGRTPRTDDLAEFLAARLPRYMLPGRIILNDTLPMSRNGKVDRSSLEDQVTELSPTVTITEPSDGVEREIARIWADVLGLDSVGVHDDFFDLGGHSLSAIRMTDLVTKRLWAAADPSAIFRAPTVASYVQEVFAAGQGSGATGDLVLLRDTTDTEQGSIVLLHGMTFGVISLSRLLGPLGGGPPIYALTGRSLDALEKCPPVTAPDIAARYAQDLLNADLPRPWTLFGHSWGGVLAFELARALESRGESPVRSVVLGDTYTTVYERMPSDVRLAHTLVREIAFVMGTGVELDEVDLTGREGPDLIRAAVACAPVELGLTEEEFSRMFHPYRLRSRASESYTPSGPVQTPVVLLRAEHEALGDLPMDLGWSRYAPNLWVESVQCRHNDLILGPNVRDTARFIRKYASSPGLWKTIGKTRKEVR